MTKKQYLMSLGILVSLNLVWCGLFILTGDFYTQYSTAHSVFEIKAVANGVLSFLGIAFLPVAMHELKD